MKPNESPPTHLRARNVSVELGGRSVLRAVDLDVEPGSWVSIIGPNGAGKTTFLRAVSGLVPFDGTVEIGGVPVGSLSHRQRSRSVALVPQNPIVPPGLSVTDYLLLGRTPHIPFFGVESSDDLDVTAGVLAQLELETFAHRPLETLSGGERQRAVLGRALTQMAPVLLLDEPTASLDVGHQQEVLELVDELRRVRGLTVLSTMHDLTLAGQYGERLVMIAEGEVVASGPAEEVLTEENVERHYRARVRVLHDGMGLVVVPLRSTVISAHLQTGVTGFHMRN